MILGIAGNKLIILDSNIVMDNVVNSTGVDMQAHEVELQKNSVSDQVRLRWLNIEPVEVLGQSRPSRGTRAISASDQVRLKRLNKDPVKVLWQSRPSQGTRAISVSDQVRLRQLNKDPVEVLGQ